MINEFRLLCQSSQVDHADLRIVDTVDESISCKDECIEELTSRSSLGFGIRVLSGGAWGFASSGEMTTKEISKVFKKALSIAQTGRGREGFKYPKYPATVAKYTSPFVIDPFMVPLESKISLLMTICSTINQQKGVCMAKASMSFQKKKQTYVDSNGSFIEQEILESGAGIYAYAVSGNDVQVRSYPNSHGGNIQTKGYEFIEQLELLKNAERVADEVVELIRAHECPHKKTTVVLGSGQLALQVHESIGHPTELDRLFNMELSLAGSSFATIDQLGKLKYGSPIVNVVADATTPGGLGTFGYDDEGVKARKVDLIKNGIFANYQSSIETAHLIGKRSSGAMRADGWENVPLIRMTNINLLPGERSFEEMISNIKDGIFMDTNRSWSIDDKRLNFQFACEVGREIKNGKLGRLLKNPNYTGITPVFWNSCTDISSKAHWNIWGLNNCGKGEPMQTAHVGHGCSPAVFSGIQVGVGKK